MSDSRGRKKITIERIEEGRARHTTFQKRKVGLMKKAMELSILCDTEVALLVFSEGTVFQYSSKSLASCLGRYMDYEGSVEVLGHDQLGELKPGKASSFRAGVRVEKLRGRFAAPGIPGGVPPPWSHATEAFPTSAVPANSGPGGMGLQAAAAAAAPAGYNKGLPFQYSHPAFSAQGHSVGDASPSPVVTDAQLPQAKRTRMSTRAGAAASSPESATTPTFPPPPAASQHIGRRPLPSESSGSGSADATLLARRHVPVQLNLRIPENKAAGSVAALASSAPVMATLVVPETPQIPGTILPLRSSVSLVKTDVSSAFGRPSGVSPRLRVGDRSPSAFFQPTGDSGEFGAGSAFALRTGLSNIAAPGMLMSPNPGNAMGTGNIGSIVPPTSGQPLASGSLISPWDAPQSPSVPPGTTQANNNEALLGSLEAGAGPETGDARANKRKLRGSK